MPTRHCDKKMALCRNALLTTEKAVREFQGKADAIDATTFDLKAVNPHAKMDRDTRKPLEILDAIALHGQTVTLALQKLRSLAS